MLAQLDRITARRSLAFTLLACLLCAAAAQNSPAQETPAKKAPERKAEKNAGKNSEKASEGKSEKKTEEKSDTATDRHTEQNTERKSDKANEKPSEKPGAGAVKKAGEKPHKANRLARETSPYLLLHAHNPVDWYPWGEEALAKAKRENKLIFLSIGYSSCHWCHVMERESFLDDEIAGVLNKHYVCIKVDREERPDIDTIYMTSLSVYNRLTKSGRGGGWPLSMFLTPEAEPFFGGTYFPARDGDRGAGMGFLTLIKRVNEVWGEGPDQLRSDAKTLTRFVKAELEQQRPGLAPDVDAATVENVETGLIEMFDAEHGGFSFSENRPERPKFPEPSILMFLLDRAAKSSADAAPRKQLIFTLERMAMGGLRDHLGGGFHRYCVDRRWNIPHFEKMLYDNGQLLSVYVRAWQLTKRDDFRRVARETADFVLREMTDARGGFYSALDAESEGEEGRFYRWDKDEVQKLLGDSDYALFADVYGLAAEPNFEEKYYVPQFAKPLVEIAQSRKVEEPKLDAQLAPLRAKLLVARDRRARPLTDTKVLASWNGLMIRGLAEAGKAFNEPRYTAAAVKCADFLLSEMRSKDGGLLRTYGQGQARLNAYLDDYAFVVDGLIALHQATGDAKWLKAADELTAKQIELFWDEKQGGFFFTSNNHESLLARAKEVTDGAEPAGNSVAAENLVYLAKQLDKAAYREKARRTIQAPAAIWAAAPNALPRLARAASQLFADKPKGK
ncbi:MAG TPA: DUF255 domain-containing protein [Pirellulaceae bacterium]|nr:DUF255 domain-containing protein [Pirellulaceae bacterium]